MEGFLNVNDEVIENVLDLIAYCEAKAAYEKNPESYSLDEVEKELFG